MKSVLKKIIVHEFAFYNAQTTEVQVSMWADEFESCDPAQVTAIFKAFRAEPGRTKPPFPGDVIAKMFSFPDKNVAWSLASDDSKSALWCEEISLAFGDCWPLFCSGDRVAARMTFLESYERRCKESLANKTPPKWSVVLSEQKDQAQLDSVLVDGIASGKISIQTAFKYSEQLQIPAPVANALGWTPPMMLEHHTEPNERGVRMIGELLTELEQKQKEREQQRIQDLNRQMNDFDAKKSEQISKLSPERNQNA